MRIPSICLLLLAATLAAFSADETAANLAAQADSSALDQQPDLYVKAAHLQLKTVDALYNQGNAEEAASAMRLLSEYSDKATDSAVHSGKKLKRAEIEIRKIATRLSNIQHGLSFDDQAPVKATVEHLEVLRTRLLDRMFSKDKKK